MKQIEATIDYDEQIQNYRQEFLATGIDKMNCEDLHIKKQQRLSEESSAAFWL